MENKKVFFKIVSMKRASVNIDDDNEVTRHTGRGVLEKASRVKIITPDVKRGSMLSVRKAKIEQRKQQKQDQKKRVMEEPPKKQSEDETETEIFRLFEVHGDVTKKQVEKWLPDADKKIITKLLHKYGIQNTSTGGVYSLRPEYQIRKTIAVPVVQNDDAVEFEFESSD